MQTSAKAQGIHHDRDPDGLPPFESGALSLHSAHHERTFVMMERGRRGPPHGRGQLATFRSYASRMSLK